MPALSRDAAKDAGKPGAAGKPAAGAASSGKPAAAAAGGAPADPLLGKTLGGCRIEKLLGRGAMGAVYKARQVKLDRDVAIKVIRPEMMTDQRMLKRFEVEARTVGKFNSANVVMVHDVGFELGVHWLVMEFVEGKNLRDHVKLLAGGRLPAGEALSLLRQAIKGLEEAQRLSIVHRDIKPDNLMLTDRSILKIADFGIAKPLQEDFSMTMTSELVGTPLYMSPEQCQGEGKLDFRSDMYSLGATFYYLLTGEPPIRASSVYELIQTKTKLANLCLWKALPGLDQNNPLSRVIERMTALDREDRYDSYEALLADLVLVEQGATITVPKVGGGRGKRGQPQSAGRGIALGVAAVLLAAGGGGYLWWRGQQSPVVPFTEASHTEQKQRLETLRQRFAAEGPGTGLIEDLRTMPAFELLAPQRDALLAEVERAQAMRTALAAVVAPAELALPFTDLQKHFADVAAAARVDDSASAEFRSFAAKEATKARAEDQLANLAMRTLSSAFVEWQGARSKVGNDSQALVEFRERLAQIELGRRALMDLLPTQRDTIERDLPGGALDAARAGLSAGGGRPESDVGAALQDIGTAFAKDGPALSLQTRLSELQPTMVEQVALRKALLDEFQRAETARLQAEDARTSKFPVGKLPFDDVADYYETLERAFDPVRLADKSLPPWAAELRLKLRAEATLQTRIVAACASALGEARSGTALDVVEAAVRRGKQQLPSAAAELDKLDLAGARARMAAIAKAAQWDDDAAALGKRLTEMPTLAEFLVQMPDCTRQLEALTKTAGELGAEKPPVTQRLQAQLDRWRKASEQLGAIAKKVVAGELQQADGLVIAGVPGTEGRADLATAGEVVTACRDAFTALERSLDLEASKRLLAAARTKAQSLGAALPGVEARVRKWQDGIDQLASAAAGMVPIPGGRTRAAPTLVPAFFLASSECSRAEFAQFLTELRQAVAGIEDRQQRLDKVAARFPGVGLDAERLQSLIERDLSRAVDKTPMENMTWYSAAAFAAWYGRTLPSMPEWSLAAFGDGNKFEFPWGNGWSTDAAQRNPSNQQMADVDSGGLSWRQADGVRLHHLAGNVAEWLFADAKDASAGVAGGRYNDNNDTNAREQAAGKELKVDKTDARRGVGFRTALRPRAFFGADWPK